MKKRFFLAVSCVAAIFLVAGVGQASTVIDFKVLLSESSFSQSLLLDEGDLTITATAKSGVFTSLVNQSPLGLGVSSWALDDPQIDGVGRNDLLLLEFNKEVTLISATFSLVDCNDDFKLFVDDSYSGTADIPNTGLFATYAFDTGWNDLTGTLFGFTVGLCNDDYMLARLEVETSTVPIPAAGVLFVSSMAGVLAVRKRRRYKS